MYRADHRYAVNNVLDLHTYKVCKQLQLNGAANAAAFSSEDNQLAIAKWDGWIEVLSVPSWRLINEYRPTIKNVASLKFSRSGDNLSACDTKNTVVIWLREPKTI